MKTARLCKLLITNGRYEYDDVRETGFVPHVWTDHGR